MNVYQMPFNLSSLNTIWMNGQSSNNQQPVNYNLINNSTQCPQITVTPIHPNQLTTNYVIQQNPIVFEDTNSNSTNEDSLYSTTSISSIDTNENIIEKKSTYTQTECIIPKKIKPIRHPALKLKTPIAYDKKTDPSVIPILKEGMGVCESCGAIGVKDSFYSKTRKFCSMSCSRNYSSMIETHQRSILNKLNRDQEQQTDDGVYSDFRFEFEPTSEDFDDYIIEDPLPSIESHFDLPDPIDKIEIVLKSNAKKRLSDSYSWNNDLNHEYFKAASVSCFRHAPGFEVWDTVLPGIKIEVDANELNEFQEPVIWVATIIKIFGYKALLRYEGLESNSTHDFWLSILSSRVHHVGWAASKGKSLTPPKCLLDCNKDWRTFLLKRLTNSTTLPVNFFLKVSESLKSRFNVGQYLEVIDKTRLSVVRIATIREIIGKRLHLSYVDGNDDEEDDHWCHEDSPSIHPIGWANKIGHPVYASNFYSLRTNKKNEQSYAPESVFKVYQIGTNINLENNLGIKIGMKLEALDPWNIAFMGVATIQKILKMGFIMVSVDTYDVQKEIGSDWFCYHIHSPFVFPVGYSEKIQLPLHPPFTYENAVFKWPEYLNKTNSKPVPESFFKKWNQFNHRFTVNMKLEAVDLMTPRLVCVATIADVKGRHLKITFDGWGDDYDQWIDCSSSEIYPVGWSEVVGYRLESPKIFSDKDLTSADDSITSVATSNSSGTGTRHSAKNYKWSKKRSKKRKTTTNITINATSSMTTYTSTHMTSTFPPSKKSNFNTDTTNDSSCDSTALTRSHIKSTNLITTTEDADLEVLRTTITTQSSFSFSNRSPSPTVSSSTMPLMFSETNSPNKLYNNSTVILDESSEPKSPMISSSTIERKPFIPRIIDLNTTAHLDDNLDPDSWTAQDVAEFLKVNDCVQYSDAAINNEIDGIAFLAMKYDDIRKVTNNKAGPLMKIQHLITKLTRLKCLKKIHQTRL